MKLVTRITVAAAFAAILIAIAMAIDPHLLTNLLSLAPHAGGLLLAVAPFGLVEHKAAASDNEDGDFATITRLVVEQGESWRLFHDKNKAEMVDLKSQLRDLQVKGARQGLNLASGGPAPTADAGEVWIDTKTHERVPVLRKGDSLAAFNKSTDAGKSDPAEVPTVGRFLRGIVMGSAAHDAKALDVERKALGIMVDPSGGYTVGGALSSNWIDLLRAQMVLTRAGALTVPMDTSTLALAKVTADPTVFWHAENADITAGESSFGKLTLTARTCVCLVKMSLEVSQDSANIDQILQSSMVNAMAGAIDSAGLVGVTTDAAAAPSGIFNLADRNTVTGIGAPVCWDFLVDGMYELTLDNVPMESIGAMVAHPALWKKMRKLKTGIASDNTPLTMPDEVAKLPKLWTTAVPLASGTTAKAVVANWSDLLFGVRKSISVQVLQQAFLGSNLQVGVLAYARVDFGATRQQSFCTMEGITVA